jgi:nanoRNase/pAp phosphatase (c-di-AMP/oligoRNAs hydrolase)
MQAWIHFGKVTLLPFMAAKRKRFNYCEEKHQYKNTARDRLHAFWAIFEKEDEVLVVINADPDALAFALAIKKLLRYRVKSVTIAHPNEIRRLNNVAMVERLKIPLVRLKDIKNGDFSKKVMVDSQPDHLPCFEKLKIDAIIDHHPVSGDWDAEFLDIRPEYGASSSMAVEYLRAAGLKPSVALATALFYGIKVDTQDFEQKSVLADGISFRYLFNIANRDLVRKFELTDLRPSELKYFNTALSELKYSKRRYYSHIGRVRSPDVLVIVADFLNHVGDIDWVFISGIHGEKLVVIFRCDGYRKSAGKLANRIFGSLGSAGGHKGAARAEVPLKKLDMTAREFSSETLKGLIIRHI